MGEKLLRVYSREELVKIDPTLPEFEVALTQVAAEIQRRLREIPAVIEPTVVEPVISRGSERQPLGQTFRVAAQFLLGFL